MNNAIRYDFNTVLCQDRHALKTLFYRLKRQTRQGFNTEALQAQLNERYQKSQERYRHRQENLPRPHFQNDLPVLAQKERIKELIAQHQVVIISGETGSGKTTQLPQICLELGLGAGGQIAHTQPRRIAARSVAARIAEELSVPLGAAVGYQVRFDEQCSPDTVIKLMTDGLLLAETLTDPYLNQYEVIIIDEAHERSLNIDFLLGYLHRLLEKRRDLKLIITSATIDAEKFARHFHQAPQINVSGRTYPVEIRYREPPADSDLSEEILAAIDELDREQRGDILIFLPTERDIRETATFLSRAQLPATDILPLFGRLSLADQQAVFRPKNQRRIVLATNVAETSLTVPRIKYVIDTGTARMSRYSLRTKTQRLPIEAISQASANQRAGRCGRLSAGVCIRLYSEEDFQNRPEFTEPEILRTNLAAVILQMLLLNLAQNGDDIARFPFVDPPEMRQINDGYRLLFELKAVDNHNRLTDLGRKMARLPIDPRFARIVFAAEEHACLHETLIVLAALSIQDPRERPFDKEQHADMRHREFADKTSDFQTLLNLFAVYQKQRRQLSNNKLQAWCKSYFLNAARMQEWRALVNQLLRDVHQQKLTINDYRPRPVISNETGEKGGLALENPNLMGLHRSLLAGFLDQVGLWDEQNKEYAGPRQRKFSLFPASVLAKARPQAVMAAHIMELNRVYARMCAPIELHELEQLAAHLTKTQLSAPHWSKRAGNVLAEETVLLYGLPIVAGRKKPLATQDRDSAHEIFIREALVSGEINTRLTVIARNQALRAQLETLEDKTRSRGIVVDEEQVADFYLQRLPVTVYSTVTLEQWAKKHHEHDLLMTEADLLMQEVAVSKRDYPENLAIRGYQFPLKYVFDPTQSDDGITVLLPLTALNAVCAADFERLVPAMLQEKIEMILRRLPKMWRRQMVPIPDFAQALYERIVETETPLIPALISGIDAMKGLKIPEDAFDQEKIDDHYRMNFRLLDAKKQVIAEGRDLEALQKQYAAEASLQFQKRSHSQLASDEIVTDWLWENLLSQEKMRGGIIGYPALTLEDGQLYLRLHDDPERAERAHRVGVRFLLMQKLSSQIKYLHKNLPYKTQMSLHYRKISSDIYLLDDIISALVDQVCLTAAVPRTQKDFSAALLQGEKKLVAGGQQLAAVLVDLLAQYSRINEALRSTKPVDAKNDIERQLARLVFPSFIRLTERAYLNDIARYLHAVELRLQKLARDPQKDAQRQKIIAPWEEKLSVKMQQCAVTYPLTANTPKTLQRFFYLLEEFRIQVFAQELGTKEKVSEKQLQILCDEGEQS